MTRTKGLKAEPEDGVGGYREEVSNEDHDKDKIDINDGAGESCAMQSNKGQEAEISGTSESITSGQSGDCPIYFTRVYIHLGRARAMVCALDQQNFIRNKRTLLPTIKWCHE